MPMPLPQVYQQNLWMLLHGAPSPKPTTLYSNMIEIAGLNLGVLTRKEKEMRTTAKLTRTLVAYGIWF